ncbi:bile acid:sodium symporter [Kitasatospora sp. RB6PN24]|uniref:bile acid:sodium symporter family protein n=1 Tax=Kitasatospora humi TaxID=2893891 RepID=UPI001E4D0E61|nr:bile acid:sodium symporter family protein [Kitasatospora humi]MCC9311013.1 bile acid:sodium symporter [Kitasatospora humi]
MSNPPAPGADKPARRRLPQAVDPYLLALTGCVALAALWPATGRAQQEVNRAADAAVGLLFFLYGARLSAQEMIAGLRHWRLQLAIAASTFVLFPLLGLLIYPILPALVGPRLATGVLFLCLLPSTIQSSIAFTSIARGNVPAAVCAGTCSSLLGMLLTPLLAATVLGTAVHLDTTRLAALATQILLPFAAGQAVNRWIGPALARHRRQLRHIDRGSILLVVYTAFSHSTANGLWQSLTLAHLLALLAVDAVLLATVLLTIATTLGNMPTFDRADRIALVFAGSKKSLVNGMPMAAVLFGASAGAIVVPVMLFHQTQLLVCSVIAKRWSHPHDPPLAGFRASVSAPVSSG